MSKNYETPKKNYTIVPNSILNNNELSIKERGMWATLASLPDNWGFSVKGLKKILPDGTDAISNAIKSLESKGYVTRPAQQRNNGKYSHCDWILDKEPCKKTPYIEKPLTETPSVDNPIVDISSSKIPTQLNTKDIVKKNKENKHQQTVVDILSPYNLNKKTIDAIVKAANGDIDKIRRAAEILQKSNKTINNVPGFLISCIKGNYTPISYKPRSTNGFRNFSERNYDYDDLMRDIHNK